MKIILEGLNEQEQAIAKILLVDALYAFVAAREDNYVERRYASQTEAFKARKAIEVEARKELASKLAGAAFGIEFPAAAVNPSDLVQPLAEFYVRKFAADSGRPESDYAGKIHVSWDADSQRFDIRGDALPAHPDLVTNYPNGWSLLDHESLAGVRRLKELGLISMPVPAGAAVKPDPEPVVTKAKCPECGSANITIRVDAYALYELKGFDADGNPVADFDTPNDVATFDDRDYVCNDCNHEEHGDSNFQAASDSI